MVRELFTKSSSIPLQSVSLSVDDLLSIVEAQHFEKVTGRNNGIAFDSFEDMKANKALLVGNPRINCGDITISLDKFSPDVSIHTFSNENFAIAKSIASEIRQRKNFLDLVADRQKYIITPILIVSMISLFVQFSFKMDPPFDGYFKRSIPFLSVVNILLLIMYLNFAYLNFFRRMVYYRPKEGFFRRNFEKIVVGIIGAAIGIGLKALFDHLITP